MELITLLDFWILFTKSNRRWWLRVWNYSYLWWVDSPWNFLLCKTYVHAFSRESILRFFQFWQMLMSTFSFDQVVLYLIVFLHVFSMFWFWWKKLLDPTKAMNGGEIMNRLMAFWSTIRYYSGFDSGEIHCEILLDPIETGLGSLKRILDRETWVLKVETSQLLSKKNRR